MDIYYITISILLFLLGGSLTYCYTMHKVSQYLQNQWKELNKHITDSTAYVSKTTIARVDAMLADELLRAELIERLEEQGVLNQRDMGDA